MYIMEMIQHCIQIVSSSVYSAWSSFAVSSCNLVAVIIRHNWCVLRITPISSNEITILLPRGSFDISTCMTIRQRVWPRKLIRPSLSLSLSLSLSIYPFIYLCSIINSLSWGNWCFFLKVTWSQNNDNDKNLSARRGHSDAREANANLA